MKFVLSCLSLAALLSVSPAIAGDDVPLTREWVQTGYKVPGPTNKDPNGREWVYTGYKVPGPTFKDPYTGRWIEDTLDPKECLRNGLDPVGYPSCWGSSGGSGGAE